MGDLKLKGRNSVTPLEIKTSLWCVKILIPASGAEHQFEVTTILLERRKGTESDKKITRFPKNHTNIDLIVTRYDVL